MDIEEYIEIIVDNGRVEDMEKLSTYVSELEWKINFYKNALKRANDYKVKYEKLRKKNHIYKIEIKRLCRKLTRLYKYFYDWYYIDFGRVDESKRYVNYLKKL